MNIGGGKCSRRKGETATENQALTATNSQGEEHGLWKTLSSPKQAVRKTNEEDFVGRHLSFFSVSCAVCMIEYIWLTLS